MDSVAKIFFDNISVYDDQTLSFSGRTYSYLDEVKENLSSVLVIHILCNGHRCKNDFRNFPLFLQEPFQHAHMQHVNEVFCYAYDFADKHHCFAGVCEKWEGSYTNICLFDNYVLRHISLNPEHVKVPIKELFDRYAVK